MLNLHPSQHTLFIIDPQGNLVLSYPDETDTSGILRDLKHLLRVSRG